MVRSHAEINEGCGRAHEGCYTVFSAPNPAKNVLGGILVLKGKLLEKEGMVFSKATDVEVGAFKRGEVVKENEGENDKQ